MDTTQVLMVGIPLTALVALWMIALFRQVCAENAARRVHIANQKRADEVRKQHSEWLTSVAEEAARLEAAGILTPHVKASLVASGVYGR